ncbi:MAG TPA: sigma-70 family RNA polymerase sigma factor [Gemmataceae bacterium]
MSASLTQVFAQVQRWTSSPCTVEAADVVLLERFVQGRDEAAFAALVARYGAMVLRSCRRVLGDAQESEDAFQATFLILARKAPTLRRPEALPGWLHGVARRVALKARTKSATRFSQTQLPETLSDPRSDPLTRLTARELLTVLDEEVQRLPSAQRSAVVLCCLEGHTQEEAARVLGWSTGSLKGHLERGRRRLHVRLTRRGIALSAALAVVAVSHGEAVSALLRQSTVRAALGGVAGSPMAAALAESVLKGTFAGMLASVTALMLTMALSVSAVALVYRAPEIEPPGNKTPDAPAAPKEADADKSEKRVDAQGDPLPAGAIARLGTVRFRPGRTIAWLIFLPDGKRLVSVGHDGAWVWDIATGKELGHLTPPTGKVWAGGCVTPEGGGIVAAVSQTGSPLELWDLDSGKKVGTLGERCRPPIRFSPDGKLLATPSEDNRTIVDIWDVASRKKLRTWTAHSKQVMPFAFSADSRQLLTNGLYDEVRVWDVATGKKLQEFRPLNPETFASINFFLRHGALSPDSKLIAFIEGDEKREPTPGKLEWKERISLRDVSTGKVVRQLTCPVFEIFPGQQPVPFRGLTFTPDGKELIASGPDHCLRIWEPHSGKELRPLPLEEWPGSLALSKDGKKLAVVTAWGTAVRVLDLKSGQPTTPPGGHLMPITMAALTPDGRTAVTGSLNGPPLVWDVATGRVRHRLEGHESLIDTLQLSGDGRTLYSSGWDKTLCVWDLATGQKWRRIPLKRDPSGAVAGMVKRHLVLTPNGQTLATLDSDKVIRIVDVVSGEERRHFQGPEDLLGMGLTPDGRSLVAWSVDHMVRVWDTATGRKLREYPLPRIVDEDRPRSPHEYYNAALSPDGRLLAMGPVDRRTPRNAEEANRPKKGSLILKDLTTSQIVRRLDNLPSEAGLLAFSPDGRTLVWTGFRNTNAIRLLEVASGCERRRLVGHRGEITALAFSADGRRLLSGCKDTTALVWDLAGRSPATLTAAELEALWADLAGADAARAYRAIHQLAAAPESSLPFLRKRLQPAAPVDEKRVARLLADLDNEDFAVRQKATAALRELSDQPLAAYRKALEGKPSLETRRRLEDLLEKAGSAWWDVSGERLRSLRAVEALELAGTKEAREILTVLAGGAPAARLSEQAKAALHRLASRERNGSPR